MHFPKMSISTLSIKLLLVFLLMINVGHIQAKDAAIAFEIEQSIEETFQKHTNENSNKVSSVYYQEDNLSE